MQRTMILAAGICALMTSAVSAQTVCNQAVCTRTSSFLYRASDGLLVQEVVEPDDPALRLQTNYAYDAFGNKDAATVSGAGIETRTTSSTYDTKGRFVTVNTNAVGHQETWEFDARFGKPTKQTGPNGLSTRWEYDGFGRKTKETRADGTYTVINYLTCGSGCPATAVYYVRSIPYGGDNQPNGPVSRVYFDELDREVARETQGFDGTYARAEREYDNLGNVARTTRPFFVGTGTPQSTVYDYDWLGRVTLTTQPDGTVNRRRYQGLVTTEWNSYQEDDEFPWQHQTRFITKNARGEVIAVKDALGQTMTYAYDPFGNLTRTTDHEGNVVTAAYDRRGRKRATNDPNLGNWIYDYNVLNELISQTDAKNQTTTFSYDKLGRMKLRVEPDMRSEWVYDGPVASRSVGKLISASVTAGASAGYQRAFTYDSLGRPDAVSTTIDAVTRTMQAEYNDDGRLSAVTYPSGFVAQYGYNALGYFNRLSDRESGKVYSTIIRLDAEQHIRELTFGNNLVGKNEFDPATGRLTSTRAALNISGASNIHDLQYFYDRLGNPTRRLDSINNVDESFTYDKLNRLATASIATNVAPLKSLTYGPNGNILSKTGVGDYLYPQPGQARPHAVTSITRDVNGTQLRTDFTYDPNGNEESAVGGDFTRTMVWTSYNKPASITSGADSLNFLDDFDHQRFKQVTVVGGTMQTSRLYFRAFGVQADLVVGASGQRWEEYLSAGSQLVGVRFFEAGTENVTTRYFHTDHLGSVSLITNEMGAVVQRLSYDAWGKRRHPNGADDPTRSIATESPIGFTGQEHLNVSVGLVHLNGRVYDPHLGRMTSADPLVADPLNPQGWNRYSYVGNDPLKFTDPSGFSWLSDFFRAIGNFFRAILSVPIVRAIVQIALSALGPVAAVLGAMAITGLSGGKLSDILKAGILAVATIVAFQAIGDIANALPGGNPPAGGGHGIPDFGSQAHIFKVASHAGVGCLSSVASGGECGSGALSGGAGALSASVVSQVFADPVGNMGHRIGGALTSGAIGGLASLAGGGKFENGAVTAAFGYLYNLVGLACRPIAGGAASHCGLFVRDDETGNVRQFSLGGNQTKFNTDFDTFVKDRIVYDSGTNFYVSRPPAWMSSKEYDAAVIRDAESYGADNYNPVWGPNSNSAAAYPIIMNHGTLPFQTKGLPFPQALHYWSREPLPHP